MTGVQASDTLRKTLTELVSSGGDSNPALTTLISDYTRYHVVLVVVGGLFLLALVVLCIVFCVRFTRAPRTATRRWTFEKRTYFLFGILTVLVAVFMALVVAANVSNVVSPERGFAGAIPLLGTPKPGTPAEALQQSVSGWIESGGPEVPSVVQSAIDDRLSWQRPKAIICTGLLVILVVLTAGIWRTLIRMSRAPDAKWRPGRLALLVLGVAAVLGCLLLMLMVIGNTQGSIAPISLTLFYG